ncbi:MAG: HDIG domain-containing protein [Clostridia bacterium]|nr:HDIG domain-containing protein [Clostridia bacterium]
MNKFSQGFSPKLITALSLLIISIFLLFSNKTGQISLNVGDVSPEDIYAPRAIVDETTTNAGKQAARDSVEKVYIPRDDKRIASVETVTNLFSLATNLRTDKEISASQAAARFRATTKLDITEKSSFTIIKAKEAEFSELRSITEIINSVMADGVSDVDVSLEKCMEKVNKLKITDSQKNAAKEIISLVLTVNLEVDEVETERRRQAAEDAAPVIEYKKNQIILRKGEIASDAQMAMLRELGILKGENPLSRTYTAGIILLSITSYFVIINFFKGKENPHTDFWILSSFLSIIMVIMVFYGGKYIPEKFMSILPIGYLACILSIFAGSKAAIITNLILSLFCGVAFDSNWDFAVCMILGGTLSSYAFGIIKRRNHLLPASILSAISFGVVFSLMSLIEANGIQIALTSFLKGFIGGFLSGILTIGTLPMWEWIFNATTPMKLTELSNPENKLLKKLLVEAPGTYHHSLTVANISEIAAREIGANSLLARVGAYYHDIGKIRHPLYFRENQYDKNEHDSLSPEESASLIINHVKDGYEIAQKHHLPKAICDIILQHHGTTTAGYFLLRAKEKNKDIDEALFTYKGPTPHTKEAAIVMIADSCEAAVRSITEKSEEKIDKMVRSIINERVSSGQLSNCNLTFAELEIIIKVVIKTLGGYFHERIKYE